MGFAVSVFALKSSGFDHKFAQPARRYLSWSYSCMSGKELDRDLSKNHSYGADEANASASQAGMSEVCSSTGLEHIAALKYKIPTCVGILLLREQSAGWRIEPATLRLIRRLTVSIIDEVPNKLPSFGAF